MSTRVGVSNPSPRVTRPRWSLSRKPIAKRCLLLSAVVPIAKENMVRRRSQWATHAHTHLDIFMFLFHRVSLGGGMHEISAQARRRERGRTIHVLQLGRDTLCRRSKARSTVAIVAVNCCDCRFRAKPYQFRNARTRKGSTNNITQRTKKTQSYLARSESWLLRASTMGSSWPWPFALALSPFALALSPLRHATPVISAKTACFQNRRSARLQGPAKPGEAFALTSGSAVSSLRRSGCRPHRGLREASM